MSNFATDQIKLTKNAIVTDEGFLSINSARIARVGVQEYIGDDGNVIRRFRPEEEVKKSVKSFDQMPVTLEHPPEFPLAVTNADKYLKGFCYCTDFNDGWVTGSLKITHADAVIAAMTDHRQLSCGYWFDVDATPGTWIDERGVQGEPGKSYDYDESMINIRGNHIALVPYARAGENATWDGQDTDINIIIETNPIGENSMTELKEGSILDPTKNTVIKYQAEDTNEIVELVNNLRSELSQIKTSHASDSARIEGENAGLKAKISELETALEAAKNKPAIDSAIVANWLETYEKVKSSVGFDSLDPFQLSVSDLKKLYLKSVTPDIAIDGKADEFIDGVYCVAIAKSTSTDGVKDALDSAQPTTETKKKTADVSRRKANLGKFGV